MPSVSPSCGSSEVVLASLPSSGDGERLQVVLRHAAGRSSTLVLAQQSWSSGLGWYNQASLELSPEQVRELKAVLRVEPVSASVPRMQLAGEDLVVSLPFPPAARAESA